MPAAVGDSRAWSKFCEWRSRIGAAPMGLANQRLPSSNAASPLIYILMNSVYFLKQRSMILLLLPMFRDTTLTFVLNFTANLFSINTGH
jgi:hypothetical protein